jgi:hypothetical protein
VLQTSFPVHIAFLDPRCLLAATFVVGDELKVCPIGSAARALHLVRLAEPPAVAATVELGERFDLDATPRTWTYDLELVPASEKVRETIVSSGNGPRIDRFFDVLPHYVEIDTAVPGVCPTHDASDPASEIRGLEREETEQDLR